ncbi:MAG: CoA transferase [Chloroflexi bacterium]|nr:CoA transferase [Chloroflexota bacterium]
MTEVLEGITVLDFTQGMAGSIATMVLSDFGAEVIKVEPPEGDSFREFPAARLWNRGKKSVTLDLKKQEGRRQAQQLSWEADAVIESFRPGVAHRLGIGYETLSKFHPELVYCSITGFGPLGPYANYKGYEGLVEAKSGRLMSFAGQTEREGPNYAAVNVASHSAAMAAVRGVVSSLMVRDRTGQGQKVETSLLQAITYYDMYQWMLWQMMIKDPENFPNDPMQNMQRAPALQYLPARTKDGQWIQLANLMDRLFRAEIHAIGMDYIYEDPRFASAPLLMDEEREQLREIMLERIQEKTLKEWMDLFINEARDVAAEPFLSSRQALDHLQMVHNGHVQEVDDPVVGRMRQLGPLCLMSDTPPRIKGPAPEPGQHNDEVLSGLNGTQAQTVSNNSAPMPQYPLEGVTVLDFSTVIAGPLGGSLLAEMGARVIRVETLQGDYMRQRDRGAAGNRTMAGTEGLSLDLKTPEAMAIINALIPKVDILMHNMRPGAPERLGIGFEQVRELNPNIIYMYVAGYGSTGPFSHRPAMHPIGGAVSGGAVAQAGKGGLPPPDTSLTMDEIKEISRRLGRAQDVNPDPNTSMVASAAMVLGLYARQRFGTAQYLETTMIGANAYANADDFFDYQGSPERAVPDADGYGLNALYRLYKAQEGWVFLACPLEKEWRVLCQAIGRQDLLDDAHFVNAKARLENDDALILKLEDVFRAKSASEWEMTLTAADVGCVQVEERAMFHFFDEDPHIEENGFTSEVESPRFGTFWRYSPVLRFSQMKSKVGPGIQRGQHTFSILGELGYSKEQIEDLKARGVLDWEEP